MCLQILPSPVAFVRRPPRKAMKLGDRAALAVSLVLVVYVVVTLPGIVRQAWQLYGEPAAPAAGEVLK